ncbi:unnamed protein product, partial [Timema podura]|nr:unnamed protein product [Timema podura]
VFYAGQSYSAVPAKKNQKLTAKDDSRLRKLSDFFAKGAQVNSPVRSENKPVTVNTHTGRVELSANQAQKDADRLRKLRATTVIPEQRPSCANEPDKLNIGINLERPTIQTNLTKCTCICVKGEWKTTLSTYNQDLNLNRLVNGSLVYCESGALDHAATEASYVQSMSSWSVIKLTIVSEKLALGAEPSERHKTAATTVLGLAVPQLGRGLGSSGNVDLLP